MPVAGVGQAAVGQVLQEPGLVDGHQRPEPHGDRRELPELRHQPRVRVGRQPAAAGLLPELVQLLLGQASFHERPGVDAGRGVALQVDQVPAMALGRGVPEVVEAHVVQGRGGLEARDVPAQLGGFLVGPQHDGHRVPPDHRPDGVLDHLVARVGPLPLRRDGVQVRGVRRVRHRGAVAARLRHQLVQQEGRPAWAVELQHRIEGIEPFAGLGRIQVARHLPLLHHPHPAGVNVHPLTRSR